MNNPNPFLPQASLLERQTTSRSRLKIAVFSVLLVCVTGLVAMLIQGCKRSNPDNELAPLPVADTNSFSMDANFPPLDASNTSMTLPAAPDTNVMPVVTPLPPVDPIVPQVIPVAPMVPVVPVVGQEYTIVKGDSLAKIAKKHGITIKALEEANPGVQPTKLKIGKKLIIPAGGGTSAETAAPTASASDAITYTVKSGDTLSKIAKAHGVTIKALQTANGLTTTRIVVGKKLKIPAKTDKAVVAPVVPVPVVEPVVAPVLAPMVAPTAPVNQ